MKFGYEKKWVIIDPRIARLNHIRCKLNDNLSIMETRREDGAFCFDSSSPTIKRQKQLLRKAEKEIREIRMEPDSGFDMAVYMDAIDNIKKHAAFLDFVYGRGDLNEKKLKNFLEIVFGKGVYERARSTCSGEGEKAIDYFYRAVYPFVSREISDEYIFSIGKVFHKRFSSLRKEKYSELEKKAKEIVWWFQERGIFLGEPDFVFDFSIDNSSVGKTDIESETITISPEKIIAYSENGKRKLSSPQIINILVHEIAHFLHAKYSEFFPCGLNSDPFRKHGFFYDLHIEGNAMNAENLFLNNYEGCFSEDERTLARIYFNAYLPLRARAALTKIHELEKDTSINREYQGLESFVSGLSDVIKNLCYEEGFRVVNSLDKELLRRGIPLWLRFLCTSGGTWSSPKALRYFVKEVFIPEASKR